jgi:lysyl-tRNA synthetase class I
VPVCSEHGGVASSHVTDKDDKFATWDYVCKDGTPQRPVLVQDANGSEHLEVPSDR